MGAWRARAMEAIWLAAAVAIPLAFNPWSCSPFELPKTRLLQALSLLIGLAGLMRLIEAWDSPRRSSSRRPVTPLIWPALAFGLVQVLATAFSVNPRLSLWGSYERQQGLLTLSAYLALFLLTATGLRSRAQVRRLLKAVSWSSTPVVAYGLLQVAGLDRLDWRIDAASRALSTIGRANFLGSYLVLVAPLTAACLLLARRRWFYGLLLALQLLTLALTQARGAWVGLGVAALTFGLVWAFVTRNRRWALATLALAASVVSFVALLNWPGGPLASLVHLPGLERLATLTRTSAGSTAARLTIWRATHPLIAARPWLGYGPETMRLVFARVFPPQLVYYQGRHVIVDRAHNLWLDLAMSGGLASVVTFGALLIGLGWLVWRGLQAASDRWERVVWVGLAGAIAGHLADLQFGFDLTASATIFWLLLGLAAAMGRGMNPSAFHEAAPPKRAALFPYLFPVLATLALVGQLCLRPLLADLACWRAHQGERPLAERLAAAQQAARLWPLEPEYRLHLAWAYLESGDPRAAKAQLVAADSLNPDDPSIWAARGELYALWGQMETGRYRQAEAAYRRALELAPNVAIFHTALGLVLAHQERWAEGVAELERAVALDATDGVAYRYLADLYQAVGRDAQADWARREAARWEGKQEVQMGK